MDQVQVRGFIHVQDCLKYHENLFETITIKRNLYFKAKLLYSVKIPELLLSLNIILPEFIFCSNRRIKKTIIFFTLYFPN